jgi:hypothetical protein
MKVRSGSAAATAGFCASVPDDVRAARAKHLLEFNRRSRLTQAHEAVEAAKAALARVRDSSAEEAALQAALKRLAEIEREAAQ